MHDLHDSWTLPSVLKAREVIIFSKPDRTDGLRVPQVARSPKVAIFVPTTTDIQTDCITLACACARGVMKALKCKTLVTAARSRR